MKLTVEVKVKMPSVQALMQELGVDKDGDVQRMFTKMVCDRMTKYMPASPSQVLSKESKRVVSPTQIEVESPYAHYQYKGEVWGPNIPVVENGIVTGWWSPPNKHPTGKSLEYDKSKNEKAGPLWDVRMMEADGDIIRRDMQEYIDRRSGR